MGPRYAPSPLPTPLAFVGELAAVSEVFARRSKSFESPPVKDVSLRELGLAPEPGSGMCGVRSQYIFSELNVLIMACAPPWWRPRLTKRPGGTSLDTRQRGSTKLSVGGWGWLPQDCLIFS